MLLLGGIRELKMEIPTLQKLKVPLTLFAINVGGGTQVAASTPRTITITRSK